MRPTESFCWGGAPPPHPPTLTPLLTLKHWEIPSALNDFLMRFSVPGIVQHECSCLFLPRFHTTLHKIYFIVSESQFWFYSWKSCKKAIWKGQSFSQTKWTHGSGHFPCKSKVVTTFPMMLCYNANCLLRCESDEEENAYGWQILSEKLWSPVTASSENSIFCPYCFQLPYLYMLALCK